MGTGNSGFILVCSGMVFLMTPALAFFYGGLERRKNILNTMMMVICTMGLASVLWVAAGYSLSFSGTGAFIGNILSDGPYGLGWRLLRCYRFD